MRPSSPEARLAFRVAIACVATLAGGGRAALAQDTRSGDFAVERFQPAPGPNNFVVVETARVPATFATSFGMVLDYARDPLRVRDCAPSYCSAGAEPTNRLNVVRDLGTATLLGAITPIDRLQIGLRVPIHYIAGDGVVTDASSPGYGGAQPGGIAGFAMGDPALEAKVRAIGAPHDALTAGVALGATAPLGHATADGLFAGYGSPSFDARAIVDVDMGRYFAAADLGAAFKSSAVLGTLDVGSELRAGVGGGVRLRRQFHLLVEGFGSTNFSTAGGRNAAEIDSALRYLPAPSRMVLTFGGGVGLNQGAGVPAFRLFAGVGVFLDDKAHPSVN